jgi:hypothetical protein
MLANTSHILVESDFEAYAEARAEGYNVLFGEASRIGHAARRRPQTRRHGDHHVPPSAACGPHRRSHSPRMSATRDRGFRARGS